MTQTDKIIKVVIILTALAGIFFFSQEYLSQIKEANERIELYNEKLYKYTSGAYCRSSSAPSAIKNAQENIEIYEQKRGGKLAILFFGNLAIIGIAIGINVFLTRREKVE